MSFIDKAKQKIKGVPRMLGEETVRIVDYDNDQEEQPQSQARSAPAAKSSAASKEKRAATSKPDAEKPKKSGSETPGGTAFNIEAPVSFFNKKKKPDAIDKVAEELVKTDQNKIKDVLEILDIPATFEIGEDTFLPDDIENMEFDYQAPHGYDMGQVMAFVDQSRDSIRNYVKLLRLRNEHIAKLATVVDRLQVDLNNQRFDSEIANGINIMPTQDDDDLNNQNMELRLLVMRLREELESLKNGDDLSTDERKTFENLQDELSIVTRERDALLDTNYELKTKVSYMEEDLGVDPVEDEKAFSSNETSSYVSNEHSPFMEEDPNIQFPTYEDTGGLPDFNAPILPDLEEEPETGYRNEFNPNSAFFDGEDLTLDEFIKENQDSYEESEEDDGDFSIIEIMGETPPLPREVEAEFYPEEPAYVEPEVFLAEPVVKPNPRSISLFDEEDEDDELDEIMKQEFGEK